MNSPNAGNNSGQNNESNENKNEESSHSVPNPFDKNEKQQLTQEEIDNEQKFKEALTERD